MEKIHNQGLLLLGIYTQLHRDTGTWLKESGASMQTVSETVLDRKVL